ncbi:MAG: 50S ribosomal protein L6 [Patescibacteria group bacterium]|nr:50S ribosomal protein L6 [Patescibacteria group bacterium]
MSRIGKKPILIPEGVEVIIDNDIVTAKGPKGELSVKVRPEIKVEKIEKEILVSLNKSTSKNRKSSIPLKEGQSRAFWGLFRSLIFNIVTGVFQGYEKKLEIQGVGYKATLEGDSLILNIGFSDPVMIKKPENINFLVERNIITISGIDKELVGQIAAKIRKVRPPEPYKGKGIRYVGEEVRRKAGKKAAAVGS